MRETGRAIRLAEKLARLVPSGESDALLLESYRLAGLRARAEQYFQTVPRSRRDNPKINVVLALFERDAGDEAAARRLLAPLDGFVDGTAAGRAIHQPISEWPEDLHAMTITLRQDAAVEGIGRRK